MYNGIIVVNKETGFTSFDVVAKMRGIFGQKKIGHTGTLDPDATGVLPVCLGNATKVCDMLTDSDKEYRAVLLLGTETDTQDISGTVTARHEVTVPPKRVEEVITFFVGAGMQIPPMYSALKVNGQKLCDLARAGKTVERKARPIHIYEIEILNLELPRVEFRVLCSKGTYIRTLCHDIGRMLGCGGCMESLIRTKAAGFMLKDAVLLEELQAAKAAGTLSDYIKSTDSVFRALPAARTHAAFDVVLKNGNPLEEKDLNWLEQNAEISSFQDQDSVRIYDSSGKFQAVYRYDVARNSFRPLKMFLE